MRSSPSLPPDQQQRLEALDASRSILVRAPAGSGKTDLLTRRFFRLLTEVDEPGQVVAITFTNAAAAEMRHRILAELEKAAARTDEVSSSDEFSMETLATRALAHARRRGWKLLHAPAQLRIATIDSFCRDLALQQPMLSGLGGGLEIHPQPAELYRRAARRTLEQLSQTGAESAELREAIEQLLLWRDNNWQELEELLVKMLAQRDRWMQGFVLGNDFDLEALRARLERPFAAAVREQLDTLAARLDHAPGVMPEVLALARFACEQSGGKLFGELAELAEAPTAPFASANELAAAHSVYLALAEFLLTATGSFRKTVNVSRGFPADRKREKERFATLIAECADLDGLEAALMGVRTTPPASYSEEDWTIVRTCFTLLRHAAAELRVAFAEAGSVDFVEIAQIAERTLIGPDGLPSDAAIAVADGIRHLLVDEFQDTSRRQHRLVAGLVAAWPEREGRTCFVVGDPMQSIYFFRDADAELFPRVQNLGLELPDGDALPFDFTPLKSNFRTAPELVDRLNEIFAPVFAVRDGSEIEFAAATPAREPAPTAAPRFELHLDFEPYAARGRAAHAADEREQARDTQIAELVALVGQRLEQARILSERYRIAILGRARRDLAPIALALRQAAIPFRAVDLEKLADRPEILDALALARALANPFDRVAWLGVLRAPWCGLSLAALHALTGGDEAAALARPVAEVAVERLARLAGEERTAAERTLAVLASARTARAERPTERIGTWLESVWLGLGGALCADETARANLDLLWSTLDRLPNGAEDLAGPALQAAIANLTALPDPTVDPECGVQLMTIHKSKGLEFELVIVPELHSSTARTSYKLLSWLERGLTEPDESGEITEFLIAPLQTKGSDRGSTKAWVDRVYLERERQEMRRILYVAATRAREELHLFARCATRQDANGAPQLVTPSESLLATAWPAFEQDVRQRFASWVEQQDAARQEEELESIAAAEASNLLVMPRPEPTLLRHLPATAWLPIATPNRPLFALRPQSSGPQDARHEGSASARALGVAVHTLLEELTGLRATLDWPAARAALAQYEPRAIAQIRAGGVEPVQAAQLAAEALALALDASQEAIGQWLLSPHTEAQSEVSWVGVVKGAVRTVRVDRLFRAGHQPGEAGDACWWIVDYKTALAAESNPEAALAQLRPRFAPQLAAYAAILKQLHGVDTPLRAALYYPRMGLLDWWPVD